MLICVSIEIATPNGDNFKVLEMVHCLIDRGIIDRIKRHRDRSC